VQQLEIELIPAGSPQAKGRVERFNGTAQDRLVKELRLAGATTIQQANGVLEATFLPWFNRHCTVQPASANNAHRPLPPSIKLAAILSIQQRRKVANDYTIRFDNTIYQLLPPARPGLRGGWVIVEQRLDGTRHIRFKAKYLKYEHIGSASRPGALPPDPRSLSHPGITAEPNKPKGCATEAAQPSAVYPAAGRSGRTPAEPYPPNGQENSTVHPTYRPPPSHPWRKPFKRKKKTA